MYPLNPPIFLLVPHIFCVVTLLRELHKLGSDDVIKPPNGHDIPPIPITDGCQKVDGRRCFVIFIISSADVSFLVVHDLNLFF